MSEDNSKVGEVVHPIVPRETKQSTAFGIQRVIKKDTETLIMTDRVVEDEFLSLYISQSKGSIIMEPPYNPAQLYHVVETNNTLLQCIEAMVVNIDGTGAEIRLKIDEPLEVGNTDKESPEEIMLRNFFDECYPNLSFLSVRKDLRRDLETTGNAYLEIIRNIAGELVFVRALPSVSMRLARLDDPVPVEVEVQRNGKPTKLMLNKRERRYVQKVGVNLTYFKEFGSSRKLNKNTGYWTDTITPDKEGSEIIHFTLHKNGTSPYGVPRWVNNLPSALGSRKAEEYNLGFFDAGGLPPVLIFIQGGRVISDVRKQLESYISGSLDDKYRGYVVEVESTSGSLDKEGKVDVKVERFGDVNQKDSLFMDYDIKCTTKLRNSFRIPSLFFGSTDTVVFASIYAACIIAEEQVFRPEREEFDEVMKNSIMKELGAKDYVYTSLPLSIADLDQKLKGVDMLKDKMDVQDLADIVNDLVGLSIRVKEETSEELDQANQQGIQEATNQEDNVGNTNQQVNSTDQSNTETPNFKKVGDNYTGTNLSKPTLSKKIDEVVNSTNTIIQIANEWMLLEGLIEGVATITKQELDTQIEKLGDLDKELFNQIITSKIYIDARVSGLDVVTGCDYVRE